MECQRLVAPILSVEHLRVGFQVGRDLMYAVTDASLEIPEGGSVGLVGESGSGKSTVARAILGLHATTAKVIEADHFSISGRLLNPSNEAELRKLRGGTVAMVFQDPLTYLNPLQRVGTQIRESIRLHDANVDIVKRVAELLDLVRLPSRVELSYPHEISGGMRQRVLLAIALACRPKLLVADEPTTALDVTTQAEILQLLKDIRVELKMALLLISHDLGAIAEVCEQVYVMYAGKTIECGCLDSIFDSPAHPYTQSLLRAAKATREQNGRFVTLSGELDSTFTPQGGCSFTPRCHQRLAGCDTRLPPFIPTIRRPDHSARCWLLEEDAR